MGITIEINEIDRFINLPYRFYFADLANLLIKFIDLLICIPLFDFTACLLDQSLIKVKHNLLKKFLSG